MILLSHDNECFQENIKEAEIFNKILSKHPKILLNAVYTILIEFCNFSNSTGLCSNPDITRKCLTGMKLIKVFSQNVPKVPKVEVIKLECF